MTLETLGLDPALIEARKATATVREIAQQPRLWRETAASLAARRTEVALFLGPLLARPELRIVLTGSGTSAFAGEILSPGLSAALGRRVEAIAATDIVADPAGAFSGGQPVLLVSFARSGNSPESVAATVLADGCATQAFHLVVTCNREGELFRSHEGRANSLVLLMPEGANDEGFAMTSSVTCMMLAAALALSDEPAGPVLADRLARAAEGVMETRSRAIGDLAARRFERIVYLGSGAFKGLAREASLKVMELSAGEALSFAETPLGFRHGPKSLLNERCLAFVFVSGDPYARAYDLDILAELSGQLGGQRVVAIAAGAPEGTTGGATWWSTGGLDGAADWEAALPLLVHGQIFALRSSIALGKNVDNPFPSGEVNRVVQGVTIHPYAG